LIISLYLSPEGALKQNLDEDEMRAAVRSGKGVLWVDFFKPTPDEIFLLDEVFGFHPLALEDCQHVMQQAKLDDFGSYLFLVFLAPNPKFKPDVEATVHGNELEPVLELDMFLGMNYVVTYRISQLPFLNGLLERAKRDPTRTFGRGASFLAHDILDAAIDQFFAMVDKFQGEAESAEYQLQGDKPQTVLTGVLELKRRVLSLRRQMSDHRELINRILRINHKTLAPESHIYFRNILDHLQQIERDLDVCSDTIDNAREGYLAIANARTNEIMKALTMVFTLSLPFTVVTSWFGMNFAHLPHLDNPSAPYIVTGTMSAVTIVMFMWLRAKRWF